MDNHSQPRSAAEPSYQRGPLLYEGKAKSIFSVVDHSQLLWQEFKDSFTAFNGVKKATMEGKGAINCQIAGSIYRDFAQRGISTHLVVQNSDTTMVTNKLEMIPLEVVVRNRLAGSTAKKFGIAEGSALESPLVEFYYKKDELNDPFISDAQALMLKAVRSPKDLEELKSKALQVNGRLLEIFNEVGVDLVDFKLEYGYDPEGDIVLGDEISPDSCRLWDQKTGEKMDKDRFRRDLGDVLENYREILNRLKKTLGEKP